MTGGAHLHFYSFQSDLEWGRHGYEAALSSASWGRSIWGQSFCFGFSFVVSKSLSFGFSFVIWKKFQLCNLTNPKFYVWFYCLKIWNTQHFSFSNHVCLYILPEFQQMCHAFKKSKLQLRDLIKALSSLRLRNLGLRTYVWKGGILTFVKSRNCCFSLWTCQNPNKQVPGLMIYRKFWTGLTSKL